MPDLYVQMKSTANAQIFEPFDDILLEAELQGNQTVNKVQFYKNASEFIGEAASEPWEFLWTGVPQGLYPVRAVAFADGGTTIASDDIMVQVGEFGDGHIAYEKWWDIGGSVYVSELTNHPDYPDNPDETSYLSTFETPSNIGEEFGSRIIGYIHPPQTGNYSFWISGDDYSELWLSTDSNASNFQMIAEVPGWSMPGEWEKYPEQHSAEIALEVGNKYLIMALHKEAYDNDNLAVAWDYTSQSRHIIPGIFLSPADVQSSIGVTLSRIQPLEIYPNPASESFYIGTGGRKGILTIRSLSGQLIYQTAVRSAKQTIKLNTRQFKNGVYLVNFKGEWINRKGKLVVVK
jgi:hypothetical protein